LGPLEVEILAMVWEREPDAATVRDLYEELRTKRTIAYTTVMTVLGNLTTKGLLERDSSQTTYRYRAAIRAAQVRGQVLDSVVSILYRGRVAVAVADLLGLTALDEAQLAHLRSYGQALLGQ
jgi:predicted transcriptional regulator